MLKKDLLSALTDDGIEVLINGLHKLEAEIDDVVTLADVVCALGKKLNKKIAVRVNKGGTLTPFFHLLVDKDVADTIAVCKLDEDEYNLGNLIVKDREGNDIDSEAIYSVLLATDMRYVELSELSKLECFLHKNDLNNGYVAICGEDVTFDEIVAELD